MSVIGYPLKHTSCELFFVTHLAINSCIVLMRCLKRIRAGPQGHQTFDALPGQALAQGFDEGLAARAPLLSQAKQTSSIARREIWRIQVLCYALHADLKMSRSLMDLIAQTCRRERGARERLPSHGDTSPNLFTNPAALSDWSPIQLRKPPSWRPASKVKLRRLCAGVTT